MHLFISFSIFMFIILLIINAMYQECGNENAMLSTSFPGLLTYFCRGGPTESVSSPVNEVATVCLAYVIIGYVVSCYKHADLIFRLFMLLKIREVTLKDQGLYNCVITFSNKTVKSEAELTVINTFVPVVLSRIKGKCVPYDQNGVCSMYFRKETGNHFVYQLNEPISLLNEQLLKILSDLKTSKKLSKQ